MEWIADHQTLKPGRVLVCPPKRLLEVVPDGDCSLRPIDPHHMLRPIDSFLASVAESYGQGAMPLYNDDGSVRGWMVMSIDLNPEGA